MNTNNITKSPTAMSEKPPHRGGGLEGGSPQTIKNREAFFDYLEEGLQGYFDNHDRLYGGILHLTVGVREGQVGGIIKSEQMLHYSGFTLDRVKTILAYVLPRFVPRTEVALAMEAVIEELRMEGAPSNSSQARLLGADKSAVVATDAPFASAPKGEDSDLTEAEPKPKKPRTRGRKKKTEVEPQNTEQP